MMTHPATAVNQDGMLPILTNETLLPAPGSVAVLSRSLTERWAFCIEANVVVYQSLPRVASIPEWNT